MAITRVHKTKNYSIVSNVVLNDARITNGARGLLLNMLSKPDDWKFNMNNLVSSTKEGIAKVRNELNELQEAGYLEVIKILPNESGTGRLEYEYHVFEIPKHCQYLENGDVYDTVTGKNITMSLPNTMISSETEKNKKIAKFISKYINRHSFFKGTAKELVLLFPDELQMYEGALSKSLNNIESILYEMYDIQIERKRIKGKRILYIYNYEDIQESVNCASLETDQSFVHEMEKEQSFHEQFVKENGVSVQDAKIECCTDTLEENGVSVQDAENSTLNSRSRKQHVENHTLLITNTTSTNIPRTKYQELTSKEDSTKELDSGVTEKAKKKNEQESLKKNSKGQSQKSNQDLKQQKNDETGIERTNEKINTEIVSEPTRVNPQTCDCKKLAPYLDLINSISEDKNIKNNFYRFLKIRVVKHRLTVDQMTIENFIRQLREFSSQMYNGKIQVYDEVMQAILTTAVTSESKTIYDLNSWTKTQIIQKANQNQPVWSHKKDIPVYTEEEREKFNQELKALYQEQMALLEKQQNERKEKQKGKRGDTYGTNSIYPRT